MSPAQFAATFGLDAGAERDGVTGAAALALRYLSQGLSGFRGNVSEWSYQRTSRHDTPDQVLCRLWWPRFVAELKTLHTGTVIDLVHWFDDPGDRCEAIIAKARETFLLKPKPGV